MVQPIKQTATISKCRDHILVLLTTAAFVGNGANESRLRLESPFTGSYCRIFLEDERIQSHRPVPVAGIMDPDAFRVKLFSKL